MSTVFKLRSLKELEFKEVPIIEHNNKKERWIIIWKERLGNRLEVIEHRMAQV